METVESIPKYNLNEEEEKKEILRQYRGLLRVLKLKPGDKQLLRAAFEMAAKAHETMRRKSGEPYILHPLAVARICVEEIGLGVRSTICALLHDTVEDESCIRPCMNIKIAGNVKYCSYRYFKIIEVIPVFTTAKNIVVV